MPPDLVDDDHVETITPALLRAWPLPLDDDADKHDRGTVLVVGGSARTAGAALLTGIASLRAGAGRLQLAVPDVVTAACSVAVPEALVQPMPLDVDGCMVATGTGHRLDELIGDADAVVVGPGLEGIEPSTGLVELVADCAGRRTIVVVDAVALSCLPFVDSSAADRLRGRLVLTPNIAEASMLADAPEGTSAPELATLLARRFDAVVTVHGRIAAPDGRAWLDGTGSVGLGTSGSGDVLAGLVGGIAARGGDPAQAACWGSHLHGAAGDRLTARIGRVGFLARELLDEAPIVLNALSAS